MAGTRPDLCFPPLGEDETQFKNGIASRIPLASEWLAEPMPDPDPVIDGLFDLCDKVAVIGPSKMRKSFFVTQLAVCLARENAKTFLSFSIPKRRKVLLVQLEIKDLHQQRRLHQLCCGLFIEHRELSQNLYVLNGRGVGIKPAMLLKPAKELGIEVIIVDPLYKILEGDENSAKDMKPALAEFDRLVEETGAAVLYVHHDRKGASGDLDIRDRGSGSNVLGRDYDACLTLTPHSDVTNAVVLESLLRNYPSAEPQVIEWERMIFQESDHVSIDLLCRHLI